MRQSRAAVERQTGWSIEEFVRTACRYRTVKIKACTQIITADPTNYATHSSRSAIVWVPSAPPPGSRRPARITKSKSALEKDSRLAIPIGGAQISRNRDCRR